MNRIGFPLLVSTGLVLGMLLAPDNDRAPIRERDEIPALVLVHPPRGEGETDVQAHVVEGFLVDALGTEREVVTRVTLTPDEHTRDLPWRVRAELGRSRELLGWAGRVPVDPGTVAWPEAPVSARWQDNDGRVLQVSVRAREGEEPAALVDRYATALESLRQVARPAMPRDTLEEAPAESWPRATPEGLDDGGESAQASDGSAPRSSEDYKAWAASASSQDDGAAASTVALDASTQSWVDRDGIEHHVQLLPDASAEDMQTVVDELFARYPAAVVELSGGH